MQDAADLRDDTLLDELSQRGADLYRERLQALLEPTYNGQIAAVHLDSEDYEVGQTSNLALRKLRARRPSGVVMTMDIGPVPDDDSLTLRILGRQLLSGRSK